VEVLMGVEVEVEEGRHAKMGAGIETTRTDGEEMTELGDVDLGRDLEDVEKLTDAVKENSGELLGKKP